MQGRGALGDADREERGYPHIPVPEWLLDCCTIGAEVHDFEVQVRDDAVSDPANDAQVYRGAGLDALTLRATQVVDVLRLVVGPNIQVIVEELCVELRPSDEHRRLSHHSWDHAGVPMGTPSVHLGARSRSSGTWRPVAVGANAHAIQWPLRRLGVATSCAFPEDRLVDLWVALDSMFNRDDENRLARQRIAQRVGRLFGATRGEQKRLNRELPWSRDVRNAVVHGRADHTDAEVEDAIATADEVMRRSLVALAAEQRRTDLTARTWSPARRTGPAAG